MSNIINNKRTNEHIWNGHRQRHRHKNVFFSNFVESRKDGCFLPVFSSASNERNAIWRHSKHREHRPHSNRSCSALLIRFCPVLDPTFPVSLISCRRSRQGGCSIASGPDRIPSGRSDSLDPCASVERSLEDPKIFLKRNEMSQLWIHLFS